MNDIEKYRRASAEWLGKKMKEFIWDDEKFLIPEDSDPIVDDEILYWHPDIDANQQGMIEDRLPNELIQSCQWHWEDVQKKWIKTYSCYINNRNDGNVIGYVRSQKSKSTAFRLAWMQFYETLEK